MIRWGVQYRGGSVRPMPDMVGAFLEEARYADRGAVAMVSQDGVMWLPVPPGSTVRPAPRPPRGPRRVAVLDRRGRGRAWGWLGRWQGPWFKARGADSGASRG
jgi:hypothetical protein